MFILFLRFYFIEQCIQFLKHESAYFEIDQSKEIKREAPAILFCHKEAASQLLKEKYNLTFGGDINLIYGYEKIPEYPGRSKFDLYQELRNYSDLFYIQTKKTSPQKVDKTDFMRLFEGTNLFGNITVFLTKIVSGTRLSNCYKITTDELSNDGTFLIDQIGMATWLEEWQLFITGKNDWHGLLNSKYGPDDYFHQTLWLGQFGEVATTLEVNISPTTVMGLSGIENADECVVQHLKKAKCPYICSPIIFNFLNEWIPPCSKNEDYLCMLDYYQKTMIPELPCYDEKQKKATKIKGVSQKARYGQVAASTNQQYQLFLRFNQITNDLHDMEEMYILSTEDFIGTVGGSLGLFLGFSFLTFVTDVVGKVFDCLHGIESLSLPSLNVASVSERSDSISSENEESNSERVVNLKLKHGKSKRRKCIHHNPKNANQKAQA